MFLSEIVERYKGMFQTYPCASPVDRLNLHQGLRDELITLPSFVYNARYAVSLTQTMINSGLNNETRDKIIMYAFRRVSLEPISDAGIRQQIWRLMELCDYLLTQELDIGQLVKDYAQRLGVNELRTYLAIAENEFGEVFNKTSSIEALSKIIGDDRKTLEITAENHNQAGAAQTTMFELILKALPQPICSPPETVH